MGPTGPGGGGGADLVAASDLVARDADMGPLWGPHPANGGSVRYGWIYKAFQDAGIPLVRLGPMAKRLKSVLRECLCRSLPEIEYSLEDGQNIGVVAHSHILGAINPQRFAVLDVDRGHPGIDLSRFFWRVHRPDQQDRAHYWFRVAGAAPLKAVHDRRGWDLAPWLAVMPGSRHQDGSDYVLEVRIEDRWEEWDGEPFQIGDLPCILPDEILPPAEQVDRQSWALTVPTEPPVWVPATGTMATRRKMARYYASHAARQSVCHHRAHSALLVLVTNLRLYHGLSWADTLQVIRECYDLRCTTEDGCPYPWSDDEILHKWQEAGKPGMWPTLGASDRRAQAKVRADALVKSVRTFLSSETERGGFCTATDLRLAYIDWRGGENVSAKAFGDAVRRVVGVGTSTSGGGRRYAGFRLRPEPVGDLEHAGKDGGHTDADPGLTSSLQKGGRTA